MRTYLRPASGCQRLRVRRGMSLPELLAAMTILLLIAGALGSVASAVRSSNAYCSGQSQAAQHARVALVRIEHHLSTAMANEQFPGCRVFATSVSGSTYPDTIVIWKPLTTALNPTGLPRVNELVLYTPNASSPNELLEIRDTTNSAAVPSANANSAWDTLVNQLKSNSTATRTVITTKLHTARPNSGHALRGALRFLLLAGPTDAQWAAYRAGTTTWDNLDWPLDRYGSRYGSRVIVCHIEMQMDASDGVTATGHVVPFFGSSSFSYQVSR
jgi:prepilin-type N-terminal cleavage/methylation domain-containing protein